eukprot:3488477-Karenia_brevis.AAC.1
MQGSSAANPAQRIAIATNNAMKLGLNKDRCYCFACKETHSTDNFLTRKTHDIICTASHA